MLISRRVRLLIMSVKRADRAAVTIKSIVFGFVREHEEKETINAPAIIKYLILNYYLLEERFQEHEKCIELKQNGSIAFRHCDNVMHLVDGEDRTQYDFSFHYAKTYGLTEISDVDEGIAEYEWTIQVNSEEKCFAVGLTTMNDPEMNDPELWKYTFPSGMDGVLIDAQCDWRKLVRGIPTRDKNMDGKLYPIHPVQMRLNMLRKELSFYTNGQLICKIGESDGFYVDKSRLILMLIKEGDSAKLTGFRIKHA